MSAGVLAGVTLAILAAAPEPPASAEPRIQHPVPLETIPTKETTTMEPKPIIERSARELAQAIRERSLTSREVVEAFLKRIRETNPRVNAVVELDGERALQRAVEADESLAKGISWGPLHGVPFTIKDVFNTAGMATTAGHLSLKVHVPTVNAVMVQRLLDAGAILLGKTNTPALAMDMQTTNPLFGTTSNAFHEDWTAGGSSGGSAVAVATRMSPLEVGSDLAGSLRLPAAFNGVYALRPTYGLLSMRGHIPPRPDELDGIRRMATPGPIAHDLDDLGLLLDLLGGPGKGDHRVAPVPQAGTKPSLSKLRIAWADSFGGVQVSLEIRKALRDFAARLEAAGASVRHAEPKDYPYEKAWETWGAFVGAQGGYERSNAMRAIGAFFTRSAVANTPMQRKIVGPISVPSYMEAMREQDECIERLESFLQDYDVWLVPVSSTTAFPHHKPTKAYGDFFVYEEPLKVDDKDVPYYVATQSYTTLFSLTESPVVTLPLGVDSRGAPIGIQVVGRRFQDRQLIEMAKLLDEVAKRGR